MKARASRFVLGMVFSLAISGLLWAQRDSATLSGTVTDPAGAAVPNARISVRNLATGQSVETETGGAGLYKVPNLTPGEYEVSAQREGFGAKTATVTLLAGAPQTLDLALTAASGGGAAPSLGDLGFSPQQTQGDARQQALLDRRSHMLLVHQRLGLITAIPLVATLITSGGAGGRESTSRGRQVHGALGLVTAGLYFTTASYAIRAPKVPGTITRGPIRLHKTLAWIHGTGMILTPILGALAYRQLSRGERVHGIASAHSVAAWTTGIAYGAAIVSVSFKF